MELELKKEQFACYQALPQLSENREETTETIVPDYLPDIARIVDASGCLFLRSREIADGKAQVSGTVRMTLLYVAEDAQGMKSFEYTLPLDETIEGRALSGSADSCLDGRLCSCEVRMLNPRKVFTRVNVELTLTPYVPASLGVCSGGKEQEAYKIETLCEKKDIGIIRAIREKDFTFSDEVLLSGTKEPIQELLRTKCALRVTDCKSIGNKIVLKGVARLDAIYLDESGNLASMSSELPFSQILLQQLTTALYEELNYRLLILEGYFHGNKSVWSRLLHAFVSFLVFGAAHVVTGWSTSAFFLSGAIGFTFAVIYLKSGNIVIPMLLHFIYDIPTNMTSYIEWKDASLLASMNSVLEIALAIMFLVSLVILIIDKSTVETKHTAS